MSVGETAMLIPVAADSLVGVLHRSATQSSRGVLIVVGGPQYRVGSHRQFVLLARALASAGFPVLRFDYRGMGDASGEPRSFLDIEQDVRSAVDALFAAIPSLTEIVIWGLCDAASAALLYAASDDRVSGLVLLNPWVRTETGYAKALVRHYYLHRVVSGRFWRKLLTGGVSPVALGDLLATVGAGLGRKAAPRTEPATDDVAIEAETAVRGEGGGYVDRMLAGWQRFPGQVLVILSGNDLTADEFRDLLRSSRRWRRALRGRRVTRRELREANHTFSSRLWREQVERWTLEWLSSW